MITNFLKRDSKSLGNLLIKLQMLVQWNQRLASCLPEEKALTEHCKIVGLDRGSLIVIADNPHWVTRFRFFIPDLLVNLRQFPEFKNIKSICCKVNPPQFNQSVAKKKRERLVISENSANVMQEAAQKIQHPKLRGVIAKLAERVLNRDEDDLI